MTASEPLRLRTCVVHLSNQRVDRQGDSTALTAQEASLLTFLVDRAGHTVGREELFTSVLGYAPRTQSRALDAAIRRLRHKIESDPADPDHLLTVHGEGYRLVLESRPHKAAPPLPEYHDAFVGRSELVQQLGTWLTTKRLVTLHGPGGVGKTRLAVEALRHHDVEAALIAVPPGADATALANVVADVLDVDGGADPVAAVGLALSSRSDMVVLLDAAEAALAGCAKAVGAWLSEESGARFCVTTREPLAMPEEQVLAVEPLATDDAAQLLMDRARGALGGREWTGADEENTLERLARRLDGLPLALELAASRAALLTVQCLLDRLDDRFTLLVQHQRGGHPHHATLQATLAWSWQLLDDAERIALVQVAILNGPFTYDAAEVIVEGAALDVLSALCAKSLIQPLDAAGRLRLLDSVRAFAGDQGNTPALRHLQTEAWERLAGAAHRLDLAPVDQLAAADAALAAGLATAVHAVAAALESAADHRQRVALAERARGTLDAGELASVGIAAAPILGRAADPEILDRWLDILTAAPLGDPDRDAELHRAVGQLLLAQGHLADALARLTHAASADGLDAVDALVASGECLLKLGEPQGATVMLEDARGRAPRGSLAWARATTLLALAVRDSRADFDLAEGLFDDALAAQQALGRHRDAAVTKANLGKLQYLRGRPTQAMRALTEAADVLRGCGDLRGLLSCSANIAVMLDLVGDARASEHGYQEVARLAERLGDRRTLALATANLALHLAHQDRYARALTLVTEACEEARLAGAGDVETLAWLYRARVAATRDLPEARRAIDHALERVAEGQTEPGLLVEVWFTRAELWAEEHPQRSRQELAISERHLRKLGVRAPLGIGLAVATGHVALAEHDTDEAAACAARAHAIANDLELDPDSRMINGLRALEARIRSGQSRS